MAELTKTMISNIKKYIWYILIFLAAVLIGIILDILLWLLAIVVFGCMIYGLYLYETNKQKFNYSKGLIEFIIISFTLLVTIFSIKSSTKDFSNVITRFDNILELINRKPNVKFEIGIDPNDTTYEITKISLKNDGEIMASVYKIKIILPNKGFKVIPPRWPEGFNKVSTYDKENWTFQIDFYTPIPILPAYRGKQSINNFHCDIVYDKHLNLPFKISTYYQADYGHDGWIDTTLIIYKP